MDPTTSKLITTLVLPPGGPMVLAAAGFLLVRRRVQIGVVLIAAGFGSLLLLSLPAVGSALLHSLERHPPLALDAGAEREAGAIVLLGGGLYRSAPEYGRRDVVGGGGLERMRYAVWLHRHTGLPILVTGGSVFAGDAAESAVMARSLREDFGVTPRWIETRSRNTWENARYSRQLLTRAGIDRVYLVTHAWHMPRAVASFEAAGFEVLPAPTVFHTRTDAAASGLDYLPAIDGLGMSATALREYLGLLWYRLRGAAAAGDEGAA